MNLTEHFKNTLPDSCEDFRNNKIWEAAYQFYNSNHSDHPARKGCSSCCQDVLNWIRSQ